MQRTEVFQSKMIAAELARLKSEGMIVAPPAQTTSSTDRLKQVIEENELKNEDLRAQERLSLLLRKIMDASTLSVKERKPQYQIFERMYDLVAQFSHLVESMEVENNDIVSEENWAKNKAHSLTFLYSLYNFNKNFNRVNTHFAQNILPEHQTERKEWARLVHLVYDGFLLISPGQHSLLDILDGRKVSGASAVAFLEPFLADTGLEDAVKHVSPSLLQRNPAFGQLAEEYPTIWKRQVGLYLKFNATQLFPHDEKKLDEHILELIRTQKLKMSVREVLALGDTFQKRGSELKLQARRELCSPTEVGARFRRQIAPLLKEKTGMLMTLLSKAEESSISGLYQELAAAAQNEELPEFDRAMLSEFANNLLELALDNKLGYVFTESVQEFVTDPAVFEQQPKEVTLEAFFQQVKSFFRSTLPRTKSRDWTINSAETNLVSQEGFRAPDTVRLLVDHQAIKCQVTYIVSEEPLTIVLEADFKAQTIIWNIFEGLESPLLENYFSFVIEIFGQAMTEVEHAVETEVQEKHKAKERRLLGQISEGSTPKKVRNTDSSELQSQQVEFKMSTATPLSILHASERSQKRIMPKLRFSKSQVLDILNEYGITDNAIQRKIIGVLEQCRLHQRPFQPKPLAHILYQGEPAYSCRIGRRYRALLYLDVVASTQHKRIYRIFGIDDRDDVYEV